MPVDNSMPTDLAALLALLDWTPEHAAARMQAPLKRVVRWINGECPTAHGHRLAVLYCQQTLRLRRLGEDD